MFCPAYQTSKRLSEHQPYAACPIPPFLPPSLEPKFSVDNPPDASYGGSSRGQIGLPLDVPGSVAKSTHAGLPWLLHFRRELAERVHFWPFDGWCVPPGRSAVAEVYPALWSRSFPRESDDSHQHDAYSIAAWMRQADRCGALAGFLKPLQEGKRKKKAETEGWILGVAS